MVTWFDEQLGFVNDAVALVRRQHPRESFDFNEAFAKACELLVRHAANGSGVGAGVRVVLDVCTSCKSGATQSRNGPVPLPATTVERLRAARRRRTSPT